MQFNRDRRKQQFDPDESPTDRDNALLDRRSGIERRAGKDRRFEYDEQRNSVRYKLITNAYVVLKKPKFFKFLNPQTTKFAIVDVSIGGLQAQYVAADIHQYEKNILSIETDDGAIKIENIPFKVITDYNYTHLPDNTYLRRCGIKFGKLSKNHIQQVNEFVAKCT